MELIAIIIITAVLAHVVETVRDEHGHVRDGARKDLKAANPGRPANWVKRHAAMRTARWWGGELIRGLPSIRHNYEADRKHVELLRTKGEADRFRTRAAMLEELRRAKAEREKAAAQHQAQVDIDSPPAGEDPAEPATEPEAPEPADPPLPSETVQGRDPEPSPPHLEPVPPLDDEAAAPGAPQQPEGDTTMTTDTTTTGTPDATGITGEAGGYEGAVAQAGKVQALASVLLSQMETYQSELVTNAKLGGDTAVMSSMDQVMEAAQQLAAGMAAHVQALTAHEPGHEYATSVQAPADTGWLKSA